MISLFLIFYALIARRPLPFRIPGVVASVAAGAIVYYALGAAGLLLHPHGAAGAVASPSASPGRPSGSWTGCAPR